jgi:two-component system sensor histidine kinase AlgZ
VVAAVTVAAGLALHALIARNAPFAPGALLRNLVLALLLCGALLFYFHLRAKALSPAIAEARLQALQARIRPHFLFNSINAVLSLVRTDARQAEVALEDMADLFRVLMRDNRDLAPLADEVLLCRQYLALEKLRLGERLQVEWHLNSMPGDALVPPLVLQPLLENAVYHGIEPSSGPGVVSINIFYKGGDVHAILRNPYQAKGGRHHGGNKMALDNVRERLALHFDAEGSLESKVVADAYEVHLRMPYRRAKPAAAPHVDAPRPPAEPHVDAPRPPVAKAENGSEAPARGAGGHAEQPRSAAGSREASHG